MKHLFVPHEIAIIAKDKGFNEGCLAHYFTAKQFPAIFCPSISDERDDGLYFRSEGFNKWNQDLYGGFVDAPTHQQLIDWFRVNHKIEITILPVFREKCGYDSFRRDGWTFEIVKIEPCQHLIWGDYNQSAEEIEAEQRDYPDDVKCLKPSFKEYYEAYNKALEEAFKFIKK